MSGETVNSYVVRFSAFSQPDRTILDWTEIMNAENWSHSGYRAVMGKDQFYQCYFWDDVKGCIHACIRKDKPVRELGTDKIVCRVEPNGGLINLHYDNLPTQLVPIRSEMVLWSTDPSRGVVRQPETQAEISRRVVRQWFEFKDTTLFARNSVNARRQSNLYYRCRIRKLDRVLTGICREKPLSRTVNCRIEPRDGLRFIDYDSLAHIEVLNHDTNVRWDTQYDPLKDKDQLEKIRLLHEKKIAKNKVNCRYTQRRQARAETAQKHADVAFTAQKDADVAFTAQKNAEVAFRQRKTTGQCFKELEKDTARYSEHPECAGVDKTTGVYTCYFFFDGSLMSGTTKVRPKQGSMSKLWASEYGIVNSEPGSCEIHAKNRFVLWWR